MKKTYAYIYNWKTDKGLEIGGTDEQVKKDLKDMRMKGILTDDCSVEIYTVCTEDEPVAESDAGRGRRER